MDEAEEQRKRAMRVALDEPKAELVSFTDAAELDHSFIFEDGQICRDKHRP